MPKSENLTADELGAAINTLYKKGPSTITGAFQAIMPNAYNNDDKSAYARFQSRVRFMIRNGQLAKLDPSSLRSPYALTGGRPPTDSDSAPTRSYTKRAGQEKPYGNGSVKASLAEHTARRRFIIEDIREKLDRLEKMG